MASILNATTSSGLVTSADNSGSLQLATNNGTTAVTIDTSQNVGIGNTSPAEKLSVIVDSNSALTSCSLRNLNAGASAAGRLVLGNDTGNSAGLIFGSSTNSIFGANTLVLYQNNAAPVTIWTNNTERMRIDSSGRVTMPFQPAFRAFRSSSVSVAASGVVVFDSTITNIGSNYNTSNGRFTAPVTGMYQFAVQLLFEGLSNGNECECSIYVNGGGVLNFGPRVKYQADYTGFNGYVSMFASISIYLNANDYVQAAQITSGARTVYGSGSGVWTVFSGFLIG